MPDLVIIIFLDFSLIRDEFNLPFNTMWSYSSLVPEEALEIVK